MIRYFRFLPLLTIVLLLSGCLRADITETLSDSGSSRTSIVINLSEAEIEGDSLCDVFASGNGFILDSCQDRGDSLFLQLSSPAPSLQSNETTTTYDFSAVYELLVDQDFLEGGANQMSQQELKDLGIILNYTLKVPSTIQSHTVGQKTAPDTLFVDFTDVKTTDDLVVVFSASATDIANSPENPKGSAPAQKTTRLPASGANVALFGALILFLLLLGSSILRP